MGYHFGFDIGVASVGWSVVDDEYNIIELGSNIFPCADVKDNVIRRQMRGTRRLLRRRKNRINDFKKLFKIAFEKEYTNEQIVSSNNDIELVLLKNKALKEKINEIELYRVLLNYCKHRGITYLDDAMNVDDSLTEEKVNKKLSDYEKGIKENSQMLNSGMLPCEIQLERYNKYGKFRGEQKEKVNEEEIAYSNIYNTSSYIKEVEKILEVQSKYNANVNKKINFRNGRDDNGIFEKKEKTFKEHFIDLFTRKREYFEGPGNDKSRTDYGIYKTRKDSDGNLVTLDNLFSELVGTCTIYNGKNGMDKEFRASAASFTAETYNLLNDLNNLKIDGEKLDKTQREEIINRIRNAEKIGNRGIDKIICDIVGKKNGVITGVRLDKNNENDYHQYNVYRKLKKYLSNNGLNIDDMMPEKKYNKCMDILTLNTDRDNIKKSLKESSSLDKEDKTKLDYSDKIIDALVDFRMNNQSLFTKWHSFSYRIMNEIIPEMLETGEEQQTVLTRLGKFNNGISGIEGNKKLSKSMATEAIYNPVVKRSIRICVDILNALVKKYNSPDEIVIEMPRDKNDEEERKRIDKENKENAKELDTIIKKIKDDYGIEITEKNYRNHKNLNTELKLWNEQQGKCLYSGKSINIEDLLNDHSKFEIDHIIPISISFNDSRNNKVLVYRSENQAKGQRTPYEYLSNKAGWNYEQYETLVKEIYKDKKYRSKKENLLFKEDISKKDVLEGFKNRNLVDTRYASKVFLDVCQNYFKARGNETKVKVIRGSFTHMMRKQIGFAKDRDKDYSHHAIDSVLISFSQMNYNSYIMNQKDLIDINGEILDKEKYNEKLRDGTLEKAYEEAMYKKHWKSDIKTILSEATQKVKYWYKVDKKANRQVADQTIYGTREDANGEIYKISKISIHDKKIKEKFAVFIEKPDMILMTKYDPNTFEKLKKIYNDYNDMPNPFDAYEKDTGKKIRAGKKENGPVLTHIKYKDGKVGINIDVSYKYGHKKGKKKVLLMQVKPYRCDVYYNEVKETYKFIGIKQYDIKHNKNKLCIDIERYNEILQEEGLIQQNQTYQDVEKNGWEFRLSFYKNNIISYVKNNFEYIERFSSLNSKNVVETKPIYRDKFLKEAKDKNDEKIVIDKAQNLVSVTNVTNVSKIILDILGNENKIKKENLLLENL